MQVQTFFGYGNYRDPVADRMKTGLVIGAVATGAVVGYYVIMREPNGSIVAVINNMDHEFTKHT